MRLRPYVVRTLVHKDVMRLLRNGPALMLLGLFVIIALLLSASGWIESDEQEGPAGPSQPGAWVVFWEDGPWLRQLRKRAPSELSIRFVDAKDQGVDAYPPNTCVIELRPQIVDQDRKQVRRHVQYRYPGSDPSVLWPLARWFLSVSIEHFGDIPQFFETIRPLAIASPTDRARASLQRISVADILNLSLIGTALLTTIQFFAACGLLVSLMSQERERGSLRALLLTPASYFELVLSKAILHGGLTLAVAAMVMGALQFEVLASPLFWATMTVSTCGYFAVGLLIASLTRNQAAPNLLSFAYLMVIAVLNLLGHRFGAFQLLGSLTFERYSLVYTFASLNNPDLSMASSLELMRSTGFRMLVLLSTGLLLIAVFVGARRMRRD